MTGPPGSQDLEAVFSSGDLSGPLELRVNVTEYTRLSNDSLIIKGGGDELTVKSNNVKIGADFGVEGQSLVVQNFFNDNYDIIAKMKWSYVVQNSQKSILVSGKYEVGASPLGNSSNYGNISFGTSPFHPTNSIFDSGTIPVVTLTLLDEDAGFCPVKITNVSNLSFSFEIGARTGGTSDNPNIKLHWIAVGIPRSEV
jgi:hypothetical protein